ncbi:MAG: FAD-binding protein [Gemmatimonadales bacterium]
MPTIRDTGRQRWVNWHQTVDQAVHQYFDVWNSDPNQSTVDGYNDTTRGLQDLIRQADDADRSLRAHGGTWSFSPIAATNGVLLNTRPLNYRFAIGANQVRADYPGASRNRIYLAQCGMSVADLNLYLKGKGHALRTCGASNGQTIAGAIATGTHGGALHHGAMEDFVVGLHLINAANESVWLERQSYPVLVDTIALKLANRIVRDDAVFNAALVSFGSFGIVHGVLFEAEPMFFLQTWRKKLAITQASYDAITNLTFGPLNLPGGAGREPDHFQIVINPFDGLGNGLFTVMYRVPTVPAGSKPPDAGPSWTQGDSALEAIGLITDRFPFLTQPLASALTQIGVTELDDVCGEPGQIFKDTTTRGKAAGAAFGVALDKTKEVLEIAAAHAVRLGAPALLAVRLVKSGQATLGFTRYPGATSVIDLDAPQSSRQQQFFRAVWQELDAKGIPFTPHWGKLNDLDASTVRLRYGTQPVDDWIAARRSLLAPEVRHVFANEFTDRLGLSD